MSATSALRRTQKELVMQKAVQAFFHTTADGVDHLVAKGDVIADKDPVLKGREVFFTPVENLDKPSK